MSLYFPTGLNLDDTQSPMEILQEAKSDWETESDGVLSLVLQTAKSQNNNDVVIVHAKHLPSNRTTSLLTVIYRPGTPYPVTIQPKEDELPKFLRKSYYEPGFSSGGLRVMTTEGQTITNEWVADTPSEFRMNLSKAFNLGVVKSEVLNLISGTPEDSPETPDASEPQDEKD